MKNTKMCSKRVLRGKITAYLSKKDPKSCKWT